MKTLRVFFENEQGQKLSARVELPVGEKPVAYALLAHCFTCGKNLSALGNMSRALTQHGIAVVRFDFTGIGESEGDFADTNFSSTIDDLLCAAHFMEQHYEAPQIAVGHSLGGAAVIAAAARLPSVRAIATIGAPAEAAHVRRLFHDRVEHIRTTGQACVAIGERTFTITQQFVDDIEYDKVRTALHKLGKALLILHSPQDEVVGIENAAELYEHARHPKSFIALDGADHLLSRTADSLYVGTVVAAWAQRYIHQAAQQPLRTDKRVVVRTGETHYTTEMRAGDHFLLADEPTSVGGNNLGPTPYDLLMMALGACTGMTLRMYANRKQWELNEVKVHLLHYKDYTSDSENASDTKSKIDHIEREIELDGNLDNEQRTRLLEIADKCPIHKTLHSDIRIQTALRDKG